MPDRGHTFDTDIRPHLFNGLREAQQHPQFTLLVGPTGSGKSRILGRLLALAQNDTVVLRAADLTPFRAEHTHGDAQIRGWMRDALTFARDHRVSVILEDDFRTASDATATLKVFAAAHFRTRVVAAAVPRKEVLLAAIARQVREPRVTQRRRSIDAEVTEGLHRTEATLAHIPDSTAITVVARDGTMIDAADSVDATALWKAQCTVPIPGRAAAEWISELRRLTDNALASRDRADSGVSIALIDLHEFAVTDVVPVLPLPIGSRVRDQLTTRLKQDKAALELRTGAVESAVLPEPAAPAVPRHGMGETR